MNRKEEKSSFPEMTIIPPQSAERQVNLVEALSREALAREALAIDALNAHMINQGDLRGANQPHNIYPNQWPSQQDIYDVFGRRYNGLPRR